MPMPYALATASPSCLVMLGAILGLPSGFALGVALCRRAVRRSAL